MHHALVTAIAARPHAATGRIFMKSSRLLTLSLLCASALTASPAAAQRIDRIVAFGDSYVDDGNFFQIVGMVPPPAPFSTGRFSGGTNYVDTLGTLLDVPIDNFGIGGALATNGNTTAGVPGFTTEWNSFLAGGGGVFPTVSGTFDEDDLLVINVGANDARFYERNGGSLAGAAAAGTAAAGAATTGLNALVAAGAQNISWLAGDTSLLPEITGNTAAQEVRRAFSAAYNSATQQTLAGYAANGVIVHYLDGTALFQQLSANPAAYGLVGISCPALPNTSCIADPTQKYLFYYDQLHLTSYGFAIVGQYVAKP
jgi:outer membrane lipase/esterase